jgi:hypothetical protein
VGQYVLKKEKSYDAILRFKLDIESLPLPLRLVAYLSPEWYLETEPYQWRVEP